VNTCIYISICVYIVFLKSMILMYFIRPQVFDVLFFNINYHLSYLKYEKLNIYWKYII
jgi:hypothetical protein